MSAPRLSEDELRRLATETVERCLEYGFPLAWSKDREAGYNTGTGGWNKVPPLGEQFAKDLAGANRQAAIELIAGKISSRLRTQNPMLCSSYAADDGDHVVTISFDIDGALALELYRSWNLPETFTTATGKPSGFHCHFRAPEGWTGDTAFLVEPETGESMGAVKVVGKSRQLFCLPGAWHGKRSVPYTLARNGRPAQLSAAMLEPVLALTGTHARLGAPSKFEHEQVLAERPRLAAVVATLAAKRNPRGWEAPCPAHAHPGQSPSSLLIFPGDHTDVGLACSAGCSSEQIRASEAFREIFVDTAAADDELDISSTDVGLAERFASEYGQLFRFIPSRKGEGLWLYFDGNRWQRHEHNTYIDRHIAKLGRKIVRESANETDHHARQRQLKVGNRALQTAGVTAVRSRIAVVEGVVAEEDHFDQYPHLLSVANGIVDLRSGELLDAVPELRLSRGSPIAYVPDAQAPRWRQHLLEIFDGDEEVAFAYESDLGYSVSGEVREHVAFFDLGLTTANGKSVTHEAVKHVLGGDLCVTSTPGSFIAGKYTNEPDRTRNDIIRWRGARMIQTSELPEAAKLDEDLFKRMTGGDTLTARKNYGGEEEFQNQGKLWFRTNHFPQLDPDSEALWRRVRLHDFPVSFAGREDKRLEATLKAEAEGILARLVERAGEYYSRGGLVPADEAPVQELRNSLDFLGDVLNRFFDRSDPNEYTEKQVVKTIIAAEFKSAGESDPTSGKGFDRRMAKKRHPEDFRKFNSKTTRVYLGLKPRGDVEQTEQNRGK